MMQPSTGVPDFSICRLHSATSRRRVWLYSSTSTLPSQKAAISAASITIPTGGASTITMSKDCASASSICSKYDESIRLMGFTTSRPAGIRHMPYTSDS